MMGWFRRNKSKTHIKPEEVIWWKPMSVARTHVGHVRHHNEDSLILYTSHVDKGDGPVLALVADGMGGHAAGEVASKICVDTFQRIMREHALHDPVSLLSECVHTSNREIFSAAGSNPSYQGMGTTCSAMLIKDSSVWTANVGDSRVYQFVDGRLQQLTRDDTVVNQWVDEGRITREEAIDHPNANVLTQALGTKSSVICTPVKVSTIYKPGDRFLLCSDGLYDMIRDPEIEKLMQINDLESCADHLLELALKNGGKDNVSIILIECTSLDHPVAGNTTGIHQIMQDV